MGTSATRAKRKYNSKTYERLEITVKAGEKEKIKRKQIKNSKKNWRNKK